MAITGLLAGFNEQRASNTNYLAQLDAMQRAAAAHALAQQQAEEQKNRFAQEMAFRQQQGDRSADMDRARLSLQAQQYANDSGMRGRELDMRGQQYSNDHGLRKEELGLRQQAALRDEAKQQSLLDRTGGTGVQPRQGYRWTKDGNQEYIPGGEADPNVVAQLEYARSSNKGTNKQTAAQEQKVADANDVLGLLDMAKPFVEKGTGGYLGAGLNMVGQAVGYGGESAEANSRLKAIEGMLISKMPKMSGPQSDKDVLLYRQMAGQIGDPTVPANVKQAAMDTIRQINEKAAGGQSSNRQSPQTFDAPPDPRQYKGKTIRDPATGMRMTSNGSDWIRAQ